MPQIGTYKALGSSLGKYKASQYATETLEYAKAFETFKGSQERAMFSAIGDTVANVIGISEEMRKTKELDKYKDIAAGLPGIRTKTETYRPLGFLPEKERTTYTSEYTGAPLSSADLLAIGKDYALTGDTRYDDAFLSEEIERMESHPVNKGIVRRRAARSLGIPTKDTAEMNRLLDEHYFGDEFEFSDEDAKPIKYSPYDFPHLTAKGQRMSATKYPWGTATTDSPFVMPTSPERPAVFDPVIEADELDLEDMPIEELDIDFKGLTKFDQFFLPFDLSEPGGQISRGETLVDVKVGPSETALEEWEKREAGEAAALKSASDVYRINQRLIEIQNEKDYWKSREQDDWYSGVFSDPSRSGSSLLEETYRKNNPYNLSGSRPIHMDVAERSRFAELRRRSLLDPNSDEYANLYGDQGDITLGGSAR